MKHEIEQGLHEKLCAYILGEASDETRAEVEAALAERPELRAERERIEQTIGLVQATMSGSEELPPSTAREILAEAGPRRRRPWYAQTSFRMAAGLAGAALVGVIGFRAMAERPTESPLASASGKSRANESGDRPFLYEVWGDAPAASTPADGGEKLAFAEDAKKEKRLDEVPPPIAEPAPTLPEMAAAAGETKMGLTVDALEKIDREAQVAQSAPAEGGVYVLRAEIDRSQATTAASDAAESVAYGAARPAPGSPAPAAGPTTTGGTSGRGIPSAFGGRKVSNAVQGARASGTDPGLANYGFPNNPNVRLSPEDAERLRHLGYVSEDDGNDFFLGEGVSRDGDTYRGPGDLIRTLSPEERAQWLDHECRRIVEQCRRRPNEKPRDMFFRFWGDNAFEMPAIDPLSTFSVDVDTASYTLARRYLNEGNIPTKAQIRTEEFVNYFKADVAAPTEGIFAIHTDLAPSRFSSDKTRSMLRVVVRGKEIAKEERKPLRITFVIDTSGSMKEQGRLELVKHSMRLLVNELSGTDAIAIVAFSSDARMILPMTLASQKSLIESAIFPLSPDGSTNAAAGLRMGYELALAKIDANAQNRVVLLSDGVANTGETDQIEITKSVQLHREKGIYLNTIGVGMNNHNDALLEQLADKGDGVCSYVDTQEEARKSIVDRFTGAFETIARDVKVQVEFDPAQVHAYRLLGYENRAVADQDFRNDKIDAGEVGAGHQVTALYEIERTGAAAEKPLATVRLRWKAPRNVNAPTANEEANEMAKPVLAASQTGFEGAGIGYRRAVVVAQFAEFLRRSVHARGDSLEELIAEADKLVKESADAETAELAVLIRQSKQLILNALPACDDLCQAVDAVRRNSLLRCQEELLAKESNARILDDIEAENRKLEERIRDLLRRRLEETPK